MNSVTPPKARIAFVTNDYLGDSLVYLLMAENLRLNGFSVTFFSKMIYQLCDWLPQFNLLPQLTVESPWAEPENMDASLSEFDLAIIDSGADRVSNKYLLVYHKQRHPPSKFDLTELVEFRRSVLSPEKFAAISPLLGQGLGTNYRGNSLRTYRNKGDSMVDNVVAFCKERFCLPKLTRKIALTPPDNTQFRRYSKRIVVSPDSSGTEKNWSPSSFLKLCRRLETLGYEPNIVVAPSNHEIWRNMPGNTFDTPVFHNIGALAKHIYESGALIANDSGNGHLASFLGIPTVTIHRKRISKFTWRPDFGSVRVVCPRFVFPRFPWMRFPIWRPFVLERDILSALEAVMETISA